MSILVVLIPVSLFLGALGLVACLWTMRAGQYEDLEGAAARILIPDGEDGPGDSGVPEEPDPATDTAPREETPCNQAT